MSPPTRRPTAPSSWRSAPAWPCWPAAVAILAGLLRLGRIAQFFSESVLVGFVSGLALVIAIKQAPKLFGLEAAEGNFWQRLVNLVTHLSETHLLTLAVGAASLVLLLFLERRFHRFPAALAALVFGIGVSVLLGMEALGVHVVGAIPAGLAVPQLPDVTWQQLVQLIPGALGHHPGDLRRGHRANALLRRQVSLSADLRPGADRPGGGQRRRRPVPVLRRGRQPVALRRQRLGRRAQPGLRAGGRGHHCPGSPLPDPAVL
ncbi:MAG: SulP family inorganic anion transporter [Anaerolineae bacterium]